MKKGSLQLSINAIVVLVLAITMLGLGLAFTKGKFAELGKAIEVPEPEYPATQDDPVVLGLNTVETKAGKAVAFTVNFYAESAGTASGMFYPCMVCDGNAAAVGSTGILVANQFVAVGDYEPFRITIPKSSTLLSTDDTHVCQVGFYSGTPAGNCPGATDAATIASKQMILKVQ